MTPDAAASAFLAGATSASQPDELGRRLVRLVDVARAAWPELELAPARFVARLAELAESSIEQAERLYVAELWLALAASDGDRLAQAAFETKVMRPVLERARRRGSSDADIDDVAQRLRVQLLVAADGHAPALLGYAGRAPLERWLAVAVARTLEHARRDAARTAALDDDAVMQDALASSTDLEHGLLRAEARDALALALRRAIAELDGEDRALLRLHVTDQLGLDELARLYGVHRATAARRLERARRELGRHTRRLLATELALPPWEVESLVRVVRSSFRSLVKTYLA